MASRLPLSREVPRSTKRRRGRTDISTTPLTIRSRTPLSDETRAHVRDGLTRKLGKFASRIEGITARFDDLNGPKGGVDRECLLDIEVAGTESVVVTARAATAEQAFAKASQSAERALRRNLGRLGFSSPAAQRPTSGRGSTSPAARETAGADAGSYIGRRVGRSQANLERAAQRPEKQRRDAYVDTAAPGKSASARRAGGASTAARNTKKSSAGMTSALEDSRGRPSRKSTRKSANRAKSATNLERRASRSTQAPAARAARAKAKSRRRTR